MVFKPGPVYDMLDIVRLVHLHHKPVGRVIGRSFGMPCMRYDIECQDRYYGNVLETDLELVLPATTTATKEIIRAK